jgi:hypothetical protein
MEDWIERQIKRLRPYATLRSGSAQEWRVWKETTRTEHPVAWFTFETVIDGAFDVLRYRVQRPLQDARWWLVHRLCPKHRYHIVDTGLRPGYHDPDTQMLHACFAILSRYVHRQKTCGIVDWEATPEHSAMSAGMQALDKWWREDRPTRKSRLPELPVVDLPPFEQFEPEHQDRADVQEWSRVCKIHSEMEEHFEQEDEDMFIRLMKIRTRLWD